MFQLAWSLRFQADCLNHLMGLFLFATQCLEPPNTWWLRGCMSQMFSKTETEYCALWCHHSLLDALLSEKKLDPEWHHHHENHTGAMLPCIINFDSRRSTQEIGRDPVTGFPLKMQANLLGSCNSSCGESKAMLGPKGIQIDQCPVGVGKLAKK